MNFYEQYSSYAKKEKIYFTGDTLAEFSRLVESLKVELILKGLVSPTAKGFVFTISKDDYTSLFDLLNKYTAEYTTKTELKTLLGKELQDALNTHALENDPKFIVGLDSKPFGIVDDSITDLVIDISIPNLFIERSL